MSYNNKYIIYDILICCVLGNKLIAFISFSVTIILG